MMEDTWEERRNWEDKRKQDVRSEWERDYARLIHSSAFRRLQSKTQVLGLGESDFYRTRLTHSMEVAQIGVGIVRWLKQKHRENSEIFNALPCDALISSICLAHDIGHPPFGHGGEVALNVCMRDHGGFEGNGQTLRILAKLDKYTESHGMNPTRRMLLGGLKYPASYSQTVLKEAYGEVPDPRWLCKSEEQHPPKCYLDDEQEVVDFILAPFTSEEKAEFTKASEKPTSNDKKKHKKPKYKSLDTSIMELADDISYSLHDLEDVIALGMVSQRDWEEHFKQYKELFVNCNLKYDDITNGLYGRSHMRKKTIGGLVHEFIISTYVSASGVHGATTPLIKWNAKMGTESEALMESIKSLVLNKVIKSPNVQQLEFKGQKLVMELFAALKSDPMRLLPEDARTRYKDSNKEGDQMRTICDFIAGMTDEYATRFYEKLYYPHKGSIFDRL
ncbi:anti-phage deoxyguanosine triphosphatase [Balneatrix alpica]|uniref:Deoxyguanosinetriphosphate triphosphohydrolase-like protein n=1 Tax=Balneatrix alpica TaxID=75684 RepID=A0ABV5Z6Y8_9GAMM|nr:anti-phage deoxyguanosine triphosphatase [Balneatrix alpica]